MKTRSTAYLLVQDTKEKFSFDGVVSITHALTVKVSTDSDSSTGTDYVNNARNEPDTVTLSVISTDVNSTEKDERATLQALAQIKEKRRKCRLVTNLRTYKNMLLTEISAVQDESCPCGWRGTLTLTEVNRTEAGTTQDNSSTPTSTGNTASGGGGGSGGSGTGGNGSSGSGGSAAGGGSSGGLIHFNHIMNHAGIQL